MFSPTCGTALQNRGVQPLLDAILDYLPSPLDARPAQASKTQSKKKNKKNKNSNNTNASDPLCALAFKVIHDMRRGPLTFVRVYKILKYFFTILNTVTGQTERVSRVLQISGGETSEVDQVIAGNIAALVGPKSSRTGATFCAKTETFRVMMYVFNTIIFHYKTFYEIFFFLISKKKISYLIIFFKRHIFSLETDSALQEQSLGIALKQLQREVHDESSGQIIVAGMGELHLDIILDRLKREFKQNVYQNKVRVSYRETIQTENESSFTFHQEMYVLFFFFYRKKKHRIFFL
eukprot:GSMAST32.ASY1.ANO1.280.1 assembled CDS